MCILTFLSLSAVKNYRAINNKLMRIETINQKNLENQKKCIKITTLQGYRPYKSRKNERQNKTCE